jgi:hypothetical protein
MATRIQIEIVSQPAVFASINFEVSCLVNPALGVFINRYFINGFVVDPVNQSLLGATTEATLENLYNSILAFNSNPNVVYTLDFPFIYIDFVQDEVYDRNITYDGFGAFKINSGEVLPPEPETVEPLSINDISIEVIDTYTNERILIEETAQANACVLKYDGGDDLYKSIVASTLDFNMLVANGEDAHFLHLFTGDEKRYKVKVNAIDVAENVQLIWQGFLLPDQYKEPYIKAPLFVNFTATDMLGTLKGKYLEPWYYQNTFPISQVIAYCLAQTGLEQNVLVKPSVVPANLSYGFEKITVNLKAFLDNDKRKDLYEILTSVLESKGISIMNYRGYWVLDGFSRKRETEGLYLQFNTDGNRIDDLSLNKLTKNAYFEVTPTVSAVSPWKQVDIEFDANGTENLFSDEVVAIKKDEIYEGRYISAGFVGTVTPQTDNPRVKKMKLWNSVLDSDFIFWQTFNYGIFYKPTVPIGISSVGGTIIFTEAMVLNKYIECSEKCYVEPGILYEFEIECKVSEIGVGGRTEDVENAAKDGLYDKFFPFQIFINGVETFSNRPSFTDNEKFRYEVTVETKYSSFGNNRSLRFKLKTTFKIETSGYVTFRMLMPIWRNDQPFGDNLVYMLENSIFGIEKLSLKAIYGYDENQTISAYRDINYTTKNDYSVDLSCSPDKSVINSFGLNYPLNQNYFKTINRALDNVDRVGYHHFAPNTILELNFNTWQSDFNAVDYIFAQNNHKSVFLQKASGQRVAFDSLWFYRKTTFSLPYVSYWKLAYLTSFEGFPNIPKKYRAYPDVAPEDVLKYMHVEYPSEDYSERLRWKVFGTDEVLSFPKALAKVIHGLQSETLFTVEGRMYDIVFPHDIVAFYFKDENRSFIPTKTTIDLFAGKTGVFLMEDRFEELNDISYE